MTEVLLIRHAESAPSRALPEADWPLSDAGRRQAEALVEELTDHPIDAIYASPYVRAGATVEPLARARALDVAVVEPLKERRLADGLVPDWLAQLERTWRDFDYKAPGGESSRECQVRVHACLTEIAGRHREQSLVVCSHGNALALFLNTIDPRFGFEAWRAMPNPALFRVRFDGTWTL